MARTHSDVGPFWPALAGVLLILLLPGLTQAQGQTAPVLVMTPATGAVALADNQTVTLTWTVQNTGPTDADTQVVVEALPGWTARLLSEPAFSLTGATATAAGGSAKIIVEVTPAAGTSGANGTLTVRATGTNALNQQSTASASVDLAYIPPIVPPPPAPDYTWLYVGIAASAAAAAALVAYYFQATRVRLKLSRTEVSESPGNRATFMLLIENRSRRARKIRLRLHGIPPPWTGALMVPHVLLDSGASTDIPFTISVPRDAQPGTSQPIQVQARPHGPFPWLVSRRVSVQVLA